MSGPRNCARYRGFEWGFLQRCTEAGVQKDSSIRIEQLMLVDVEINTDWGGQDRGNICSHEDSSLPGPQVFHTVSFVQQMAFWMPPYFLPLAGPRCFWSATIFSRRGGCLGLLGKALLSSGNLSGEGRGEPGEQTRLSAAFTPCPVPPDVSDRPTFSDRSFFQCRDTPFLNQVAFSGTKAASTESL